MQAFKDVDDYISKAPEDIQPTLQELRAAIKQAAPKETQEKISYGMPAYMYKGRLIYFAWWKKHISIYPLIGEYPAELKQYAVSKATAHFPLNKKLPLELIKKFVKARAKGNEERVK